MDYLIVYDKFITDFNNMGLAVLENARDIKIKEVINGEYLLNFITPITDGKYQYIQPENFVKAGDQLFRIRIITDIRDNTGKLEAQIQCEHVYYDTLDCKFFPVVELIGQTPEQILQYALAGTRFTVGTVEIGTVTDICLDRAYPKQIIDKLIENIGGELVKDNWTVSLKKKRGNDNGVQFRFGKNVASIKREQKDNEIITRLYPYGKDGLQIAGGLGYIDSPLINDYDRPRIGYIDYKDIEDPTKLLFAAQGEWSSEAQDGIDKPMVTYSGEFLELKKLQEYGELEAYGLGDSVRIIDEGLGADTLQRIMEYETYPYEPKRSTVVLSNLKPSRYKDNRPMNVIAGAISSGNKIESITNDKQIIATYVDNVRKRLQTEAGAVVQRALVHSDADLYVDNLSNPTKAILIGNGMFAIANSKKEDGDWNFRVIATGDKLVADEVDADWVYAGAISADQIDAANLHVNAANVDGDLIGKTIKTAASGARVEITRDTLTTYNAAGQMHGPRIYPGDGDMIICHNGVPVLSVGLADSSRVSIQAMSGYELIIQDYADKQWVLNNTAPDATNSFGVFGVGPASRQTAALMPTAGTSTMHDVEVKINGILVRLALYGLFEIV